MNKGIGGLLIGLALGAAIMWLAGNRSPREHETEKAGEAEKSELRIVRTNAETWLRISKEAQEISGFKFKELHKETVRIEMKAYGRVLDPGPLVVLALEKAAQRAALDAAQREYDRLKTLHSQGQNVSTHALEVAEAAWKQSELALQSAKLRLLADWGKQIGEMDDLGNFTRSLAALESALVRLDLPLGESMEHAPTRARVASLNDETHTVPARLLGPMAIRDAQSQGRGFLCLVETNGFTPGAAVIGYLAAGEGGQEAMVVPGSAVVRQEGQTFVYLRRGEDFFARTPVALERPLASGWLVKGELKEGEEIVIVGAQQLLSEELKARNAEE